MLVAEVAGRIEGVVTGVLTDQPDKPLTLFITGLGVNEGHPRRGIGRALLAAIRAEGLCAGLRSQLGCDRSWHPCGLRSLPQFRRPRDAGCRDIHLG
jgi:Acetyltransferase (GNAT) family